MYKIDRRGAGGGSKNRILGQTHFCVINYDSKISECEFEVNHAIHAF